MISLLISILGTLLWRRSVTSWFMLKQHESGCNRASSTHHKLIVFLPKFENNSELDSDVFNIIAVFVIISDRQVLNCSLYQPVIILDGVALRTPQHFELVSGSNADTVIAQLSGCGFEIEAPSLYGSRHNKKIQEWNNRRQP